VRQNTRRVALNGHAHGNGNGNGNGNGKSSGDGGEWLVLSIGCRDLTAATTADAAATAAASGNARKVNAVAALYVRDGTTGGYAYRSRTELIAAESHPSFATKVRLRLSLTFVGRML
jgi:hypothetical protein